MTKELFKVSISLVWQPMLCRLKRATSFLREASCCLPLLTLLGVEVLNTFSLFRRIASLIDFFLSTRHSLVKACQKCSLFCSLQFCIVIFEFACLMLQSIVCNHGRFNAAPFVESFQLKCYWKLSKLTESAQIGCERTVSTPIVFSLGL